MPDMRTLHAHEERRLCAHEYWMQMVKWENEVNRVARAGKVVWLHRPTDHWVAKRIIDRLVQETAENGQKP